jgi:hypothetical protein
MKGDDGNRACCFNSILRLHPYIFLHRAPLLPDQPSVLRLSLRKVALCPPLFP